MTTNTAGTAARQDPRQVVNTLKATVNFNDSGISSGVAFSAYLPLGAFITNVIVEVVTAFNAGTTNTLTVGTNSTSYNDIVASADLPGNASTSLGTQVTQVARAYGRSLAASADKQVFAKYAQTGGAATTGQAIIVIEYEGGWSN